MTWTINPDDLDDNVEKLFVWPEYGLFSWTGQLGATANVTFTLNPSSLHPGSSGQPTSSVSWGDAGQTAAFADDISDVLKLISNVANINFTYSTSASVNDIAFALADKDTFIYTDTEDNEYPIAGHAYTPTPYSNQTTGYADIYFSDYYDDFSVGSRGSSTLLHEVLHALGISHPNGVPDDDDFNKISTVMSDVPSGIADPNLVTDEFRSDNSYAPATLMPYDIAALQYLYGVNNTYNANDNVYIFHQNGTISISNPQNSEATIVGNLVAIWDAGGDNDEYKLDATIIADSRIDLRAGAVAEEDQYYKDHTNMKVYASHIAFSDGTSLTVANSLPVSGVDPLIENATGAQGKDTIIGNDKANILKGEGGGDTLVGGAGVDTLFGGAGNDTFIAHVGVSGLDGDSYYGGDENSRGEADGIDTVDYSAIDSDAYGIAKVNIGTGEDVVWFYKKDFLSDGSLVFGAKDYLYSIENIVFGGDVISLVNGTDGNDTLNDTDYYILEILYGGLGDDDISLGYNDIADGGDDNDTFHTSLDSLAVSGYGEAQILGGSGTDTLDLVIDSSYSTSNAAKSENVFISKSQGVISVSGAYTLVQAKDVETITFTASDTRYKSPLLLANQFGSGNLNYGDITSGTINGFTGLNRLDYSSSSSGMTYSSTLSGSHTILTNSLSQSAVNVTELYGTNKGDYITLQDSTNTRVYLGTGDDTLILNNASTSYGYVVGYSGGDDLIQSTGYSYGASLIIQVDKNITLSDLVSITPESGVNYNDPFEVVFDFGSKGSLTISAFTKNSTLSINDPANDREAYLKFNYGYNNTTELYDPFLTTSYTAYSTSKEFTFRGTWDDDVIHGTSARDSIWALGGNDTVYGSDNDDYIYGGDGNDILVGEEGTDHIYGGAGGDTIYAEDQSTTPTTISFNWLYAGDGDDTVYGSQGGDYVEGGNGDDVIYVFGGSNTVYAGNGNDILQGAFNEVYGGDGDDTITAEGSSYYVNGDSGNDIIHIVGTAAYVYGGDGDDVIYGAVDNEDSRIYGDDGNDIIFGRGGNDTLYGGNGDDFLYSNTDSSFASDAGDFVLLYGEDGNDFIQGADGADYASGGAGSDILKGGNGGDTLSGDDGDDQLFGEDGNDNISGDEGDDLLYGGAGNDTLEGGLGYDILIGGAGNDTLYGGNSAAIWNSNLFVFESGFGHDTVDDFVTSLDKIDLTDFSSISDVSQLDIYVFTNSYGSTTTITISATEIITLSHELRYDNIYTLTNDNFIFAHPSTDYGNSSDDLLMGTSGADTLDGRAGNDTLEGLGGNDILTGGVGSDVFIYSGSFGNDTITDFELNIDKIDLSQIQAVAGYSNLILSQVGSDTLISFSGTSDSILLEGINRYSLNSSQFKFGTYGTSGNDYIEGTSGDDSIFGLGGSDEIYGLGGNDRVEGGDQNDWVYGGTGNDIVKGNAGNDVVAGDDGNDTLYGGIGQDYLWGNKGNDTLYGEADIDALRGMEGDDILYGGEGNDNLRGDDVDSLSNFAGAGNDILYGGAGNDNLEGGAGDDILVGGTGADIMNGSAGSDTFYYEAADIDGSRDAIYGFQAGIGGDIIDISDVLQYDSATDNLSDFVFLVQGGSYTRINIDIDGTGTNYSSQSLAQLQGVTGLNLTDMVNSGNLVVEAA
ncbi:MAG: type I secretion C-terminal target domain-containing protein [Pseudobdellovibrionaceae bacterium]